MDAADPVIDPADICEPSCPLHPPAHLAVAQLAPRVQWWSSAVAAAFGVEVLELLTLVGSHHRSKGAALLRCFQAVMYRSFRGWQALRPVQ